MRLRSPEPLKTITGRVRENFRRRRRCLCAPGNNPGKKPGGRHAVQMALL
jgi:hypothetical protein